MGSTARLSIVQYMGEGASTCGYCHSNGDTSLSSGMWCHSLTVDQYQQLIDRGWRRSGCYLYKPNMQQTCCPQYPIRLDVHKFQPNKAQKRVLKKWDRFLAGAPLTASEDADDKDHSSRSINLNQAFSDKRQKTSHKSQPETQSNTEAAALSHQRQHPPAVLQQHVQDNQQHFPEAAVHPIQSLLAEVIEACMQSGQLPPLINAQAKVSIPSEKQAKKLPAGVKMTSPIAQVLAGSYHKAREAQTPSLDTVAATLAAAINVRFRESSWRAAHGGWTAQVLNGHLNFHAATEAASVNPQPTHTSSPAHVQTQLPSHGSSQQAPRSALHALRTGGAQAEISGSGSGSQAVEGNEEDVAAAVLGSSPTNSITAMWAGPALSLSLKSALSDQQNSVSPFQQLVSDHATAGAAASSDAVNSQHAQAAVQKAMASSSKDRLQQPDASTEVPLTAQGKQDNQQAGLPPLRSNSGGSKGKHPPTTLPSASSNRQAPQAKLADEKPNSGGSNGHSQQAGPSGATALRGGGSGHSQRLGPARHLEIKMVPAGPELVDVEFPLYLKYQVSNHHDDPHKVTRHSFKRFLIDSPFESTPADARPPGHSPPCGLGSFHQQYWLDGKLIAVGVLDVLPHALSSKYFFWDSEYAALAPGKFSALKEAEWVQRAAQTCPALHYYYMGFYIHSCHKMRYKADYHPSDLLCPERLTWIPFEHVKAALDEKEYQVLSDVPGAVEGLGTHHDITAQPQQNSNSAKLSNTKVGDEAMLASLVYWRDLDSPYQLMRFGDMEDFGVSEETRNQLRSQLAEWHRLVGLAAAGMVFVP